MTRFFPILDPQNPAINEFCAIPKCRLQEYEAEKLWNVRSCTDQN